MIFFSRIHRRPSVFSFFFFNDTATTEIYTLSLHDALPICPCALQGWPRGHHLGAARRDLLHHEPGPDRSEEHTSELQSPDHLVCRLLLEKKNLLKISIIEIEVLFEFYTFTTILLSLLPHNS